MYQDFFGFHRLPFITQPFPEWFASVGAAADVFRDVSRCITRGEGIAQICGPGGCGKTLLCRVLARHFKNLRNVISLSAATLRNTRALYQNILAQVGWRYQDMTDTEMHISLSEFISHVEYNCSGMLLLIDEAHLLRPAVIEILRSLTDSEPDASAGVGLVLVGMPTLEEILADPGMNTFTQRITYRGYLRPLEYYETEELIHTQLKAALNGNAAATRIIPSDSCLKIHQLCSGIPRIIAQLTDHALLMAALHKKKRITPELVLTAWNSIQQLPEIPVRNTESSENEHHEEYHEKVHDFSCDSDSVLEFGTLHDDSDEYPYGTDGDLSGSGINLDEVPTDYYSYDPSCEETENANSDEILEQDSSKNNLPSDGVSQESAPPEKNEENELSSNDEIDQNNSNENDSEECEPDQNYNSEEDSCGEYHSHYTPETERSDIEIETETERFSNFAENDVEKAKQAWATAKDTLEQRLSEHHEDISEKELAKKMITSPQETSYKWVQDRKLAGIYARNVVHTLDDLHQMVLMLLEETLTNYRTQKCKPDISSIWHTLRETLGLCLNEILRQRGVHQVNEADASEPSLFHFREREDSVKKIHTAEEKSVPEIPPCSEYGFSSSIMTSEKPVFPVVSPYFQEAPYAEHLSHGHSEISPHPVTSSQAETSPGNTSAQEAPLYRAESIMETESLKKLVSELQNLKFDAPHDMTSTDSADKFSPRPTQHFLDAFSGTSTINTPVHIPREHIISERTVSEEPRLHTKKNIPDDYPALSLYEGVQKLGRILEEHPIIPYESQDDSEVVRRCREILSQLRMLGDE